MNLEYSNETTPNIDTYTSKPKKTKRKFSKKQKRAYCKNWKNSNLSRTEFCRQNNLSPKTFCNWLRLGIANKNSTGEMNISKGGFLPVTCAKPVTTRDKDVALSQTDGATRIKLYLNNNIRLSLPTSVEVDYLLQLLRGAKDEACN